MKSAKKSSEGFTKNFSHNSLKYVVGMVQNGKYLGKTETGE